VLKSARDAEAIALEAAAESALLTRMVLDHFELLKEPTEIFGDNEALYKGVENESFRSCDRHILKTYYWIAEKVDDGEICLGLLPTDEMPADVFTKSLGKKKFPYFTKIICGFRGMTRRKSRSSHQRYLSGWACLRILN